MFGVLHERVPKQFLAHKEEAKLLVFKSREGWNCWPVLLWETGRCKNLAKQSHHDNAFESHVTKPSVSNSHKERSLEFVLPVAHPLRLHWIPGCILSAWLAQKGGTCCTALTVSVLLLLSPPWFHQARKCSAPTTRFQVQVEAKLH